MSAIRNLAPSTLHWFGTDQLGRDILSRVIIGASPALTISCRRWRSRRSSASPSAPSPDIAAAGSTSL